VWRQDLGITIVSMAGDGERVFVYPGAGRAITAARAASAATPSLPRAPMADRSAFRDCPAARFRATAPRDDRRLIALRSTGRTSSQLVELARP
jgi:hypothetical protein